MSDLPFLGNEINPRLHRDGSVDLNFKKSLAPVAGDKRLIFAENISALAMVEATLFCASDETVSVERLVLSEDGQQFADHLSFDLRAFFPFGDESDTEVDLEGLAISEEYLWLVGSHSLKRDEPKPGSDVSKLVSKVSWDAKRSFLARIPLVAKGGGVFELKKESGGRAAAWLAPGEGRDNGLRGLISQEGLLQPFMNIPSKENGFDIEGLAVSGECVLLGLRGPVIGSHALIVELHLADSGDGKLAPQKIGERPYKLYAANLGGLGIRDLTFDGDRLLVLSGTSQKAESIQRVFAIDLLPKAGGVLDKQEVELLLTLPICGWGDHAEGIAMLGDHQGSKQLLVAHDSPTDGRIDRNGDQLTADIFLLHRPTVKKPPPAKQVKKAK